MYTNSSYKSGIAKHKFQHRYDSRGLTRLDGGDSFSRHFWLGTDGLCEKNAFPLGLRRNGDCVYNADISHVHYGIACIAVIYFVARVTRPSKLDAIPTVGSSRWLGSWGASLRFLVNGIDIIQEGYKKYTSAPFKVVEGYGWTVMLSNREHIEELRKAPDDGLSFLEAVKDQLNTRYTLGKESHDAHYRLRVIRSQLTRNIGTKYPEIRDEIETSFDEILDLRGNEWKAVSVLSTIQQVVCRTSNRVFVGLPLCRNPEWIDLNIRYTIDTVRTGHILGLFPKILKPLAACVFTAVAQDTTRGVKLLGPVIEERRKHWNEARTEVPNDFLTWFMEETQSARLTVRRLTASVLLVNFAAIHTSSNSFTHALLYLAANPQFILPLREEVEAIIKKEGWSKDALSKMCKLDSFLKESQRIEGIGAVSMLRKAMTDFRFSDGTFIPKGTMLSVAARCRHYDEELYEDPEVFKPFRFVDTQEGEGGIARHQFTVPSIEYLSFGYGRHACPGRFFAANELKTMLAHVVTAYDIKLEDGATRPPSVRVGASNMPDSRAKVMFRCRVD